MIESRSSYPNTVRIATLIIYILIIIHWNACFYIQLSAWVGFGSDDFVYWSIDDPVAGSFGRMYLAAYFWSTLVMTTIADINLPVNDFEFAFIIVDYMLGVFIFATIVGKVDFHADLLAFIRKHSNLCTILCAHILHARCMLWDRQGITKSITVPEQNMAQDDV
jgi:hypothetical protein